MEPIAGYLRDGFVDPAYLTRLVLGTDAFFTRYWSETGKKGKRGRRIGIERERIS